MVTVRPATVADAPAMGQLVVRAWQAAYRGQMPDDYLNGLRAEERAVYWDGVLRREDRRGVILVAEREGEVVGFAAAGPSPDPQGAGELYAINVDPEHWGDGAGRAFGVSFDEVRYRRRSTSEAISSATPAGTE
jgi:GNAT superfamily N-acetyltransferase